MFHPEFTRRSLLGGSLSLLGGATLSSLLGPGGAHAQQGSAPEVPHHPPRARRVVYLFMSGGPSQLELFDHKPRLTELHGTELPDSIRKGQRLTTMTSQQASFPVAAPPVSFAQHGASGAWLSELLPETARIADELCFLRAVHTDAVNHDPAMTLMQTGHQNPGRPSFGAWVSYGLGRLGDDLPTFTVLLSGLNTAMGQPLSARLWGPGFLSPVHQGVQLRSSGDSVLYLDDGAFTPLASRARMKDAIAALDRRHAVRTGHQDSLDRIEAYELAHRMQTSAPELTDLSMEPASTFALYGEEARTPGTFAASCLLARRLLERNVRFVQLYHRDWDHHHQLNAGIRRMALETDRSAAALVADLKERGLLEDTLVIFGGEFGRTVYSQGELTRDGFGRDHHPRCFSMWMAGGGIRPGVTFGETDDFGYNVVKDGVHVHDLHATVLHLLGIDHSRLTFRSQGRDFRLTDVAGRVVSEIIA